jgi:transposase
MLSQQQTLQLSAYADLYDKVVPQKHMLRQINDLIDFSFVYQELVSKYCPDNGRRAESPIRLFKYLLLKVIYDSSDVDVVERSMYDMSFKYFLGMSPEEDVINPSTLTKFRKLRLKDVELLDMLINKTVSIAIDKGIIKSDTIIVDATHSGSRSNPYSPVQALKLRSKLLRRCLYETDEHIKEMLPEKNTDDDLEHEMSYTQALIDKVSEDEIRINIPKIKERLNMLKETLDDIRDHYTGIVHIRYDLFRTLRVPETIKKKVCRNCPVYRSDIRDRKLLSILRQGHRYREAGLLRRFRYCCDTRPLCRIVGDLHTASVLEDAGYISVL